MMKVDLVRKRVAVLPKYKFDQRTFEKIGKAVAGGVLVNIASQKQADGQRLKANRPATQQRKRDKGRPALSLVDKKRRFVKGGGGSWKYKATSSSVVVFPATNELKALVRWVQLKGYVGWFGISDKARNAIRAILREFIKATNKKAKR